MPGYQVSTLMSPHNGAEDSLIAFMGKRNPMTPRLDEPQVNLPHHGHYGKNDRSAMSRKSSHQKHKSSSAAKKKSSTKQEIFEDLLDEASKEAQIVQKIEMAIKKSRSERRASSRSHSRSRSSGSSRPKSHGSEQPSDEHRQNMNEGLDENYQMIRTKRMEDETTRHRRSRSSKAPHRKHLHKPRNACEQQRYSNKNLIDLDERMDLISQMDGLVDDKRGFQVRIDKQAWINNTFSDPTLDTIEKKHFLGALDPQRIQCGPGRDQTVISRTDSSMKEENKEPDPTKSIIDRIYEKKHKKTEGKAHGMNTNHIGSSNNKLTKTKAQKAATAAAAQQMPSELISFDNYEDDDDHYYEDEDDAYPMQAPSRPPQPRPTTKKDKNTKNIPIRPLDDSDYMKDGNTVGGDTAAVLQAQLEEINKLHRDIKIHQDRMKHISAKNNTRDRDRLLNPREYSSAEVYQRELARQAQAELYRLELVQKSMMLEKQMEIYRRNLDEWNRVRDLAIKEEEQRRKITEKAKKVWQEEMRTKLTTDNSNESSDKAGHKKSSKTSKELPKSSFSSSQDVSSNSSDLPHEPSLYEKVAALNNRAVLTEEEQKIIEAEILNQLHMELSKQAAEKKLMQKPMFFSEKLRSSWSGKNGNDAGKPVEQITEELTHRIHELNLQMAASKQCMKMHPMKMPNVKALLKGVKGKHKSRFPRPKYESDSEEEEEVDNGLETHYDENEPPVHHKKKKSILKTLGLRKTKDKTHKETEITRRSAEISADAEKSPPKPRSRKDRNTISMPPPTPTSPAPVLSMSSSEHDDDDDDEDGFGAAIDGVLFHQEDEEEPSRRRHPNQPKSPRPGTPSTSKIPGATSSVSTQLTSNKVYIGVDIDGEAIEAMSVSSRNKQFSPSSSSDKSSESKDRYTTCSGDVAVANKIVAKMHPIKKKNVDDPSIYEFLEVQYYPHGLDDEDEAPLDEMEADAYRGH